MDINRQNDDHHLSYTEMYSKWIRDVSVKCETIKLSGKQHFLRGGQSSGCRTGQAVLWLDVRNTNHAQKNWINWTELLLVTRRKTQTADPEKILANRVADQGLEAIGKRTPKTNSSVKA